MSHKVLVIDDDKINATLVKFGLAEQHYKVFVAHDGQEGLDLVKKETPDLIILDVQMPRMNGYEFMRELKSFPGLSQTPVLMLTASEYLEPLFKIEGIKGYFVKPVNLPGLIRKVKECLGPNPVEEGVE